MSSKSKRRHANKQYNRGTQKTAGDGLNQSFETDASVSPEVLGAGADTSAPLPAIMTPAEFRKLEKEKAKQAKIDAKEQRKKEKEAAKKEKKGDDKEKRHRIREIKDELKKVNWPTWSQAWKATGIVLGVVVIFAFITLGIDRLLGLLYELLIGMQG